MNRITHITLEVGDAPKDWDVSIEPALHETTVSVSGVVPSNISVTGGLFDDVVALDPASPVRGLVGAFIIIVLLLIFAGASKDMSVAVIGGFLGLGINWYFELMPKNLLVISLIVGLILLVGDNASGGFR